MEGKKLSIMGYIRVSRAGDTLFFRHWRCPKENRYVAILFPEDTEEVLCRDMQIEFIEDERKNEHHVSTCPM